MSRSNATVGWALLAAAVLGCSDAGPRHVNAVLRDAGRGDAGDATADAAPADHDAGHHPGGQKKDASVSHAPDAGDAADDAGAPTPDAGPAYAFTPDPVTLGMNLPAVIPVLKVDVGGQTIQKDVNIAGQLDVYEDHDGTLTDLGTRTPTLSSAIAFQGRGNFTWTLPKKGYEFELQDAAGSSQARTLLGLPAGSDFALYACYTDKTCLRDALVYALGQQLGRWNPRTRFVELYIDGNYQGLYMVWERIRRDLTRVNLPKPAAYAVLGDLSGGYIVRHEGAGKDPPGTSPRVRDFLVTSGNAYTYHYPDSDKISTEQSQYIRNVFQSFEDHMASTPASYASWLDEASWVDHGIVEEVTNNWDGYTHSIYMTKDADSAGGLLGMGPLWDYDLAFGNGNVDGGYNCHTDNWTYQGTRAAPDNVPSYWVALYADAKFQHAWKCRYQALRQSALNMTTIDAQITAWTAFTSAARARDQVVWPTLNMSIFPNCVSKPTYDAEVQYLRDFIAARLTWLDTQTAAFPGTCP